MSTRFLLLLLALPLTAGAAADRSATPEAVKGKVAPYSARARAGEVLAKLHETDVFEIQAGALGSERGHSELVRAYADRLARDHRMAEKLVTDLASRLGAPLRPATEEAAVKLRPLYDRFGSLFDQSFVAMMIEGHLQAVTELSEAYEQEKPGSPLRDLLGRLLPILKQHLRVAENIRPWLGDEGGTK